MKTRLLRKLRSNIFVENRSNSFRVVNNFNDFVGNWSTSAVYTFDKYRRHILEKAYQLYSPSKQIIN